MKQVITTENIPIKLWLDDLEEGALNQAKDLANLPFAFKHISIMPDSHLGYGMPIGSILATKDVVVPNAVGVDIGCGMCALKTSLKELTQDQLKSILGEARKRIPVGYKHNSEKCDYSEMPGMQYGGFDGSIVLGQLEKARYQLGTLGGGNHFIEIQKGDDGFIWIMIHSGSRNLGYTVAKYYNKLAQVVNEKFFSDVPKDLAFLPIDTKEGKEYMVEMEYCVNFALANRTKMMREMIMSIVSVVGPFQYDDIINESHNFVEWEHHFGKNVLVHRKGATRARLGELGMIPGSQGTNSYIVKGKGDKMSFESCSHGAGRAMGRKQAQKELNLEEEIKNLDEKGVIHAIRNVKDLDEAPSAYKDIDVVMENQKDLVDIVVKLTPLAVIKG